jgi:5-methylcytosine-specific restriction protein A
VVAVPVAPRAYCSGKGRRCTNRATSGGLCDDCRLERERRIDRARPTASARGYDQQWRATRAAFLEEHPTCECDVCLKLPEWRRPQATDVDHRDGLGPLGPAGHDFANLRAMAHAHHSRRTAADQPGGWNRRGRSARDGGG